MKKKFKIVSKCLSFILFFCLVLNIPVRADVVLGNSAEKFTLTNIIQIAEDMPGQGWDEKTNISDIIITYDLNSNINGYIFNLKTKGKETGYIQILKSNDEYYVIAYTFQGRHYLDKMISLYKSKKNNLNSEYQIIYNGNNDFLINERTLEENKYYNLTTEKEMKENKSELKDRYNTIEKNIIQNTPSSSSYLLAKSLTSTVASDPIYVLNANNADLVQTSDFSGNILNGEYVNNHCSPTAGLNLIKYWANRRGVTTLWYNSDWWVFSSLCENMNTVFSGDNAGTTSANFLSGLRNYSTNTRGVSYSGDEWWGDGLFESCTFAKAKSYIDADVPFHLDLVDHSMVCFGYYTTTSGSNQLIVNTGWDKYWTFQNFSSFAINYYQYVRWN